MMRPMAFSYFEAKSLPAVRHAVDPEALRGEALCVPLAAIVLALANCTRAGDDVTEK
jgi:hypothetical protein